MLVGEPLARKAGLGLGDDLVVDGPEGRSGSPSRASTTTTASELGSAFVHLDTLEKLFGPGPISNVALYLEAGDGRGRGRGRAAIEARGRAPELRSNRRLRERSDGDLRPDLRDHPTPAGT